ncbi:hypothetical protein FISHEDRAFT_58636 [Fistulina hepatica ATCC 64428]|uniref:C2H2-type domain-containing protein n=1 Tax=Fistulina hepatica ATCC 64428 TaxID=1128425 RepID=A0A0D7ADD5_9AGAR|nr:hypothetical protein FISHEDRAFT_58636 [Fistulina hepatica ATCC 64428]
MCSANANSPSSLDSRSPQAAPSLTHATPFRHPSTSTATNYILHRASARRRSSMSVKNQQHRFPVHFSRPHHLLPVSKAKTLSVYEISPQCAEYLNLFHCRICGVPLRKHSLLRHLDGHGIVPYQCEEESCQKRCFSLPVLEKHQIEAHAEGHFFCKCGRPFVATASNSDREEHFNIYHRKVDCRIYH